MFNVILRWLNRLAEKCVGPDPWCGNQEDKETNHRAVIDMLEQGYEHNVKEDLTHG